MVFLYAFGMKENRVTNNFLHKKINWNLYVIYYFRVPYQEQNTLNFRQLLHKSKSKLIFFL